MRFIFVALILACPAWAADAHQLTESAREMLIRNNDRAQVEALLRDAIAQFPDDAEPLTLFAILRQGDLKDHPDELRAEAKPLFERLLILRRQNPETKPVDLALALELNALLLAQVNEAEQAAPLRELAIRIRKQVVHEMQSGESAPSQQVERVSQREGISPPSVQNKQDPEYSEEARLEKISGTVLLSAVINVDGVARQIELVHGAGFGLDEKAVEALSTWRFIPGTKYGAPVPVRAQIEINFRLL